MQVRKELFLDRVLIKGPGWVSLLLGAQDRLRGQHPAPDRIVNPFSC